MGVIAWVQGRAGSFREPEVPVGGSVERFLCLNVVSDVAYVTESDAQ